MANKVRLSRQALKQLEDIAHDTQQRYGSDQRKTYLERIYQRIDQLKDTPALGQERPDIKPGYRSITAGNHVIFYRLGETMIEIIAILHGQMDLKRKME